MEIRAAVARAPHAPLSLETLELDDPRAGEILVRVVATGVCHTDLVVRDGMLPTPSARGAGARGRRHRGDRGRGRHEGRAGDHVVMTFNSCGACPSCDNGHETYCYGFFAHNFLAERPDGSTALRNGTDSIHSNFFGQSSFATHALCHERNVVKVPDRRAARAAGPAGLRRADRSRRRDERAASRVRGIVRRLRHRIGGAVRDHGRRCGGRRDDHRRRHRQGARSGSRKPSARPT